VWKKETNFQVIDFQSNENLQACFSQLVILGENRFETLFDFNLF
jgi:hypothetical protein